MRVKKTTEKPMVKEKRIVIKNQNPENITMMMMTIITERKNVVENQTIEATRTKNKERKEIII